MRRCSFTRTTILLLAALPLFSQAEDAKQLLVGTWKFTNAYGCTETITYRADGSRHTVSGDEISDSTYTLRKVNVKKEGYHGSRYAAAGHLWFDAPGALKTPVNMTYGTYQGTITTTKDYGGMDCAFSEADGTGGTWHSYAFFNKDKTEVTFCGPKTLPCFGPFKKQPE